MKNRDYTILFVDDEPWLSEALRLSLEARDFNCISVSNIRSGMGRSSRPSQAA